MPSHSQVARVADDGIDLAICWVRTVDLVELDLRAQLIGADRLYALSAGPDTSNVRAEDTLVLVDADAVSWGSWNLYAEEFAAATGATIVSIDDGGLTGRAFVDHVRRLGKPVLNSPKGQTTPIPADLAQRPVVQPSPYWTWSLAWRQDDTRSAVRDVVAALARDAGSLNLDGPDVWLPALDPYRVAATPVPDKPELERLTQRTGSSELEPGPVTRSRPG
jgi:hypothetical protein